MIVAGTAARPTATEMRFASIGSGSRGNGTLIEAGATLVLLDCGFTIAQVEARMARLGRQDRKSVV